MRKQPEGIVSAAVRTKDFGLLTDIIYAQAFFNDINMIVKLSCVTHIEVWVVIDNLTCNRSGGISDLIVDFAELLFRHSITDGSGIKTGIHWLR